MTTINLHGILAYEFGGVFNMQVQKPKQVVEAISCNKPSFRKRILELAEQGIHYSILVDGEVIKTEDQLNLKKDNSVIDFTPVICGHGGVALVTAIATALNVGTGAFLTAAGTAAWASTLIGGVLNAVAMSLIQMALAPKPESKRTESTISGAKESFMISSKGNLAEQGVPVPVGYGRLRTGSNIIQVTIKSYPQNVESNKALGKTKATVSIDRQL